MNRLVISLSFCLSLFALNIQAVEITDKEYEIYTGDLNNDGVHDIYIHGKSNFILIHGEIVTPILVNGPTGLVLYRGGDSYKIPENYSLTFSELNQKISSGQLTLAQLNTDYYFWDNGVEGQSQVLVRGVNSSSPAVLISSNASSTSAPITKVYPNDAFPTANLSDRSLAISLQDENSDGNLDVVINGYAYLSGGKQFISSIATSLSQSGSVSKTYTYDELGRLTHSLSTNGTEKIFDYDEEDNRKAATTIKGVE